MKYTNVRRIYNNLFYLNFKKHYCPDCSSLLKKTSVSKIVNSKSDESTAFDFEFSDGYMIGNVKFIWTELQCTNCKKRITVEEMKRFEKE